MNCTNISPPFIASNISLYIRFTLHLIPSHLRASHLCTSSYHHHIFSHLIYLCTLSSNYHISSYPIFEHASPIFSNLPYIYRAMYELTSSRFLIPIYDHRFHTSNISCYLSPWISSHILTFLLPFTYPLIDTCHLLFIHHPHHDHHHYLTLLFISSKSPLMISTSLDTHKSSLLPS
jgi:hypothetical protein